MAEKKQKSSTDAQNPGVEVMKNRHGSIQYLELGQLADFKGHPFKVENDADFYELMQSIKSEGVLVPLLARPAAGGRYELLSGHRRKAACKLAGIGKVPVIVACLDDCQAVIAMVDSNLHRENLKPSEKAFGYKMKMEALKKQGKRTDLTSSQFGTKYEGSTSVITTKITDGYNEAGEWKIQNLFPHMRTDEMLARQAGESRNQIARYIRLTYLIPKILDWVDEGRIAFTVAVELSYLNEEEQYELYAVMDMEQCTPSLSQANRIKRMSQARKLDMDTVYSILSEEKPNQRKHIKICSDRLDPYFPPGYTDRQKTELIEQLLKEWHKQQTGTKNILHGKKTARR